MNSAALALGLLFSLLLPQGGAAEPAELQFRWALLHEEQGGAVTPIDYTRSIVELRSGDRFKLLVRPATPCFLYFFLHDSRRELSLLFPARFGVPPHELSVDRRYRLPGSERWYYLDDHRGLETLYLIVSAERLRRLEARTEEYLRLRSRRAGLQAANARYAVLDEIKRLINENSPLSARAERPVVMAGDVRGVREEDQLNALEVITGGVYVRTIRLRH